MTHSHWSEWDELQAVVLADHELQNIILALQSGSTSSPHFSLIQGQLFYKDRLVIPEKFVWLSRLITEFHSISQGGHSMAFRTHRWLAARLYWRGMMKSIQQFVASWVVTATFNSSWDMREYINGFHLGASKIKWD